MPHLIRHASLNISSLDVMRFLGRKPHPLLQAEVSTDIQPVTRTAQVLGRTFAIRSFEPLFVRPSGL
jgi:hypothetical protein